MRPAVSIPAVVLGAFGVAVSARADATVWTNGAGLGGATVRVTGANHVTETRALKGPSSGEWDGVGSTDNSVSVTFGWGENWQIHLFGYAIHAGASYGGTASIALLSGLDLFGEFDPPGTDGSSFRVTGSGFAHSLVQINEAAVHYAILAVNPDDIPQGFLGTADDLVAQSVITADKVISRFSASFPFSESFDDLVGLGQAYGQDNVTLLAWVHGKCVTGCLVPAASAWGLTVMGLLTLTAGTVVILRRRAAVA